MIYKLFCEILIHISSLGVNSYLRVICEMSRRVNITFISQMRTLKFKVIKYNMLLFVLNSNKIKVVNILV